MVTVTPNPSKEDAKIVIDNIREIEKKEIENFLHSPIFAAMDSIRGSKYSFCVKDSEGKPIALTGIADSPVDTDLRTGIVWLISSTEVQNSSLSFYKSIKNLVQTYGHMYDRLFNFVNTDATDHHKFIEALGFSLTSEVWKSEGGGIGYTLFEMITPSGLSKIYYLESEQDE